MKSNGVEAPVYSTAVRTRKSGSGSCRIPGRMYYRADTLLQLVGLPVDAERWASVSRGMNAWAALSFEERVWESVIEGIMWYTRTLTRYIFGNFLTVIFGAVLGADGRPYLSGSAGSWDLVARFHRLSTFPCQCPSSSVLATPAPTTTTTTPLTPICASGLQAQLPRSLQSLSNQSSVLREGRPRNTSSFGRMQRRSAPNLRSMTHIQRQYQKAQERLCKPTAVSYRGWSTRRTCRSLQEKQSPHH